MVYNAETGRKGVAHTTANDNGHGRAIEDFANAVLHGATPKATAADSLGELRTALAMYVCRRWMALLTVHYLHPVAPIRAYLTVLYDLIDTRALRRNSGKRYGLMTSRMSIWKRWQLVWQGFERLRGIE
jgi:hypothetical protein